MSYSYGELLDDVSVCHNDPLCTYQPFSNVHIRDRMISLPSATTIVLACIAFWHLFPWRFAAWGLYSLLEVGWRLGVYLIPWRLLAALDRWLGPPPFRLRSANRQPSAYEAKTETMKRILGLGGSSGGLMATVSQAARGLAGGIPSMSLDPTRPAGLGNRDNSCFQNSVLQGLSALDTLLGYLPGDNTDGDGDGDGESGPIIGTSKASRDTAAELGDFLARLRSPQYNGRTLWTPAALRALSTFQQQDAQEYLTKLLDKVDIDMRNRAKAVRAARMPGLEWEAANDESSSSQHSDDSGYQSIPNASRAVADAAIPKNPLDGLLAQRVVCVHCGHTDGLSMIPFNCMTLMLPLDTPHCSMEDILDAYTRVESIEGVDCAKCTLIRARDFLVGILKDNKVTDIPDGVLRGFNARLAAVEAALEDHDFDWNTITKRCHLSSDNRVSVTKTKHVVVARPPRSLVLHINRSVFNEATGILFKNGAGLDFGHTLDLGPWCIGNDRGTAGPNGEEGWAVEPFATLMEGLRQGNSRKRPFLYKLRAVVTHAGRHENGHYVCYKAVRSPDEHASEGKTRWWRLSDESVTGVEEGEVQDRAKTGVFMLFYDHVTDPSIPSTCSEGGTAAGERKTAAPANDAVRDIRPESIVQVGGDEIAAGHGERQQSAIGLPTPPLSPITSGPDAPPEDVPPNGPWFEKVDRGLVLAGSAGPSERNQAQAVPAAPAYTPSQTPLEMAR